MQHIVLVVPADFLIWTRAYVRRRGFRKVRAVVEGGAERADSVRRGFSVLPQETRFVLVHDAARPLVSRDIVERVAAGTRRTGAALAAWPVPDTVKRGTRRGKRVLVRGTVPRQDLWLAQTPQGFRRDVAEKVFSSRGLSRPTDDVQWAERAGLPVELVLGSPRNFKVTMPEDFEMAERLLRGKR